MSVTFQIVGEPDHCPIGFPDCIECWKRYINMSNSNAGEFIEAFGLGTELYGSLRAVEIERRIKKVLDSGYIDEGSPSQEENRIIYCGRRAGYCNEKAKQLLEMCERAGNLGVISWG